MTRKEWKAFKRGGLGWKAIDSEKREFIDAFIRGDDVQCRGYEQKVPRSQMTFAAPACDYCVRKPTATHRPYKDTNEAFRDLRGEPVVHKPSGDVCVIIPSGHGNNMMCAITERNGEVNACKPHGSKHLFEECEKLDGSPCGIRLEDTDA